METRHVRVCCWALIGVGAVAALAACRFRLGVEGADRTVALVLDYDQVHRLAAAGSVPVPQLLGRLKQAGATGVAVTETTLREALSTGELVSAPGAAEVTLAGSPSVLARVRRSAAERLRPEAGVVVAAGASPTQIVLRGARLGDLLDLGIGYPDAARGELRGAGLEIVARPRAEGNQWARASDAALGLAKDLGARLVIFAGTTTLGYSENLAGVADALRRQGLLYGYVEFGNQFGDLALGTRLAGHLLRVHSISETEMLGMTPRRAVYRFVLGVRERNIRVCYVRLYPPGGPDPVASAESYLTALATDLRSHGFTLGAPQPLPDAVAPAVLRCLSGLGALAAAALCLLELLGSRPWPTLLGLTGLAVLLALGAVAALPAAMKGCALLAALALPTLAVGRFRPGFPSASGRGSPLWRGLLLFACTSSISGLGALLIVGCLADTHYLVKLDQFAGVKLAHLLPLLAVLALQMGWDLGSAEASPGERPVATLLRGWRVAAVSVLRYWHAGLLLVCLAVIGFMVVRSGNDAGPGVPGFELVFRSALSRIFGVRPRTKEIFLGHPLLVLALARAAGGKNFGRWLLLGLGTIGQMSLVNTFSHLHTPLAISLARSLHGLWLGAVVGAALYLIVEFIERRWRRSPAAPSPGGATTGA